MNCPRCNTHVVKIDESLIDFTPSRDGDILILGKLSSFDKLSATDAATARGQGEFLHRLHTETCQDARDCLARQTFEN